LQLSPIVLDFKLMYSSTQHHPSHREIITKLCVLFWLIKPTVKFYCYLICL